VVITGALCNGPVFVAVVSKDVISLLVILGRLIHSYWMKSIYLQWKPRPRETAGRRHQPAQGRLTPHFCTRPNHGYLRCWAACTSRCTNREFLNISLLKFSVCVADLSVRLSLCLSVCTLCVHVITRLWMDRFPLSLVLPTGRWVIRYICVSTVEVYYLVRRSLGNTTAHKRLILSTACYYTRAAWFFSTKITFLEIGAFLGFYSA